MDTLHTREETSITLSNGVKVPAIGLGTSTLHGRKYSEDAVVYALQECGLRHIDTARVYLCEDRVGRNIKESGIPRQEIFIASKVWPSWYGYNNVRKSLGETLKQLDTDYIDLYMLHCSFCPDNTANPKALLAESWRALEDCYYEGLCKSIGVSNFVQRNLNDLKETWRIAPHMNQIEGHVFNYPKDMTQFCFDLGIKVTYYCPLAKGKALKQPDVIKIAEEHHVKPSQVVLRWILQKGIVSIPKSTNPERVRENNDVFHFKLTAANMTTLDGISAQEYHIVTTFNQEIVKKYADLLKSVPE